MIHPDPITWLYARSGLYMVEAPRIDPAQLHIERIDPVRPLRPPSALAESRGVIGERVAERARGKHKAAPY